MENNIIIEILVETDGDFTLSFKNPTRCFYKIEYISGKYKINLEYDATTLTEELIKEEIVDFIGSIYLHIWKDYLQEHFDNRREDLYKSINKNLFNYHPDILGGGNWSFIVSAKRVITQYN